MITINIDLGSSQEVKALVIYDHNLSSLATITLLGTDNPVFSEAVTWNAEKILHYLSVATTKRYWQIQIADDTNTDGYIAIGEIYLGDYMSLTRAFREGYSKPISLAYQSNKTAYGIKKKRFYNQARTRTYSFNGLPSADIIQLEGLLDGISDKTSGILKPFYFNDDYSETDDFWMVDIDELPEVNMTGDYFETTLFLTETMKSA